MINLAQSGFEPVTKPTRKPEFMEMLCTTPLCIKSLRVVDCSQRRCSRLGQSGQVRIVRWIRKPASLVHAVDALATMPANELKTMGESASRFIREALSL
jgi:hypothetical protein